MKLNKYEIIILDCDGVIFDSNYLKIDAFAKTFEELEFEKKDVETFRNYMKDNFGISRYEFAKYFIKDILGKYFDKILYENILKLYSQKVYELYLTAEFTKNLIKFLQYYQNKNLYIASGSDQKELRDIFKQKDLQSYFKGVFGSPKKKSNIVKDIVSANKNTIMIGDAQSDMLAAKENDIDFIFMSSYSTSDTMKQDISLTSIKNLGDLI